MSVFSNTILFTSASQATVGTEVPIPGTVNTLSKLYVALTPMSGASASRIINFEGHAPSGNYVALTGTNLTTNTSASQTQSLAEQVWAIPVAGLNGVRCNMISISGSCTATGRLVI